MRKKSLLKTKYMKIDLLSYLQKALNCNGIYLVKYVTFIDMLCNNILDTIIIVIIMVTKSRNKRVVAF